MTDRQEHPEKNSGHRLDVVGYELEIRPCRGWWSRFEGRVIRLVQSSGATEPYRGHYLPGKPGYNAPRPWWARSRDRDRLRRKLTAMLDRDRKQAIESQPERIPLEHTMAGWQ